MTMLRDNMYSHQPGMQKSFETKQYPYEKNLPKTVESSGYI
jgi:hypothetical protein